MYADISLIGKSYTKFIGILGIKKHFMSDYEVELHTIKEKINKIHSNLCGGIERHWKLVSR